jgi:hypothetical protein
MFSRFPIIATATAVAIWFGLSSSAAIAACQTWKLPKQFNAIEDSGSYVVFDLKKAGEGKYTGGVHYRDWNAFRDVKGKATARLEGTNLDITAVWPTNSTGGGRGIHYKGSISDGSISGLRTDPSLPTTDKNREVFWKSKQTATCDYSGAAISEHAAEKRREAIYGKKEASPPTRPHSQRTESNVNRPGGDYRSFEVPIERYQTCREACEADGKCKAYTYVRAGFQKAKGVCWLKDSIPARSANQCCTSGLIR